MLKRFLVAIVAVANLITWQSCEYEVIPGPVDCEENPVTLELVSVEDANCALMDGRIEVLASGGAGNYRYRIGNGDPQTASIFNDMAAGLYEISALDDNNCSASLEVTVKNSNGLNITFETTEAGCNTSNGTLTVTASDGTPPYQYKLDDGNFTSDNSFGGLVADEYDLVVTDASGCVVTQTVRIKSGISYAGSIASIIENECAISGCHNGSQFPDFRVFKNIHDNAAQVKTLTGNRTMPEDGNLTQSEIDMIACWVDDGAPDN